MAPPDDPWILILNAGSSSLKFAVFPCAGGAALLDGQVAGIGSGAAHLHGFGAAQGVAAPDHATAVSLLLGQLQGAGFAAPSAVGHRVVHGGARNAAALITPDVRHDIVAAAALAPLHNPPALTVIDTLADRHPALAQVACFDTAFHAHNPPEATVIPLPQSWREQGIRRYGFHGLSYASLVRRFEEVTGQPLPRRLLACHLGAGASLAAIVDGQGVATTMGFSPMDGLVMATRAGAMDPGVLLHLMRQGLTAADIDTLLNKQSGLLATGGSADMKTLLDSDSARGAFGVAHYCYWVMRHAGSMIAAMQGVDAIVFTGGIGENAAPVRDRIVESLHWCGISPENMQVIPADEEGEIALSVREIVGNIR